MSEAKTPKSFWFLKSLCIVILILLDLFLLKFFLWPVGLDLVTELKINVRNEVVKSPWLVESPAMEIVKDWKSINTENINDDLDDGGKTRIRYVKINGDLAIQILTTVKFPNTYVLFSPVNESETGYEPKSQAPSPETE